MAWIGQNPTRGTAFSSSGRAFARADETTTRSFLQRVYLFMSLGLAITGVVALAIVSSPAALTFIFGNPLVFYGLMIAELLLVLAFAPVAARVSASAASAMFFGYAALSGVTFSVIFLRYTAGSIGSTFVITAGMFAALSAYGATTKRDLTSLGSFCFMGLIGLILASIVNIFLGSTMLYWLTTFVGVIVFTGLVAYDTAKLKELGATLDGRDAVTKAALQGALILYLDFINLFLMLLRVLGGRRRD
ncbi:MAG TPA: Bax inhibitor-1/YccA family protein [Polyangia bacterium]|nr:Bax inhibitor-1/YccA family protein [Polyangia bacterium]